MGNFQSFQWLWKHLFFKVGHFCWSFIPELIGNIHHHIHSFIDQTMKGGEGLWHALQADTQTDVSALKQDVYVSTSCTYTYKCWLFVSLLTNLYVQLMWRSHCFINTAWGKMQGLAERYKVAGIEMGKQLKRSFRLASRNAVKMWKYFSMTNTLLKTQLSVWKCA